MKRKFLTNLALLILLNLLIKPVWIWVDISVQNAVGVKEYGLYITLFALPFILNILLDMGITNYNNRNIARNNRLLTKYFSIIVGLRGILAIIYFIVCFIAGYFLGYNSREFYFLLFLALNQVLLQFIMYLRSNITGLHLYTTNSFVSVLDRALMIIFCSILLWTGITNKKFRIEWFVYVQTVAYIIATLITFLIVLSKSKSFKIRFDWKFYYLILKQSFPFALLCLLMAIYTRVDFIMIDILLPETGKEQAGIYAQSFRIFDGLYQFAMLFPVLLLPMFARMIKQNESISSLLKLSYIILIIPSIIIAVSAIFFGNDIISLIFKEQIEKSSSIFLLLMTAFISFCTVIIFSTLLTANGSLRELNILCGICVIINIILNLILIPLKGAYGSAIACLVTQSVAAVMQVMTAKRMFTLRTNYRLIITLLLFIAGTCLLGWTSDKFIDNRMIGFAALVGSGIIFAFLIRLANMRDIYSILKYEDD